MGHPTPGSSRHRRRLADELARLRRYGLIIIDEVGYLPFEQDAANLFFQLVSSRYEHASLVLTSNLPFSGWGGVFGDQVVAAAMIDRIVHHGDVLTFERSQLPVPKQGLDWRSRHRRVVSGPARGGGVLSVDEKSQVHWPNPNRRFR